MEDINISKIFQMKDVIDSLHFNLEGHENIPETTYNLTATIRNKAFKYKQTGESKELDEGQLLNDDIYPCNCENSEFTDHGHIITEYRFLLKTKSEGNFSLSVLILESCNC